MSSRPPRKLPAAPAEGAATRPVMVAAASADAVISLWSRMWGFLSSGSVGVRGGVARPDGAVENLLQAQQDQRGLEQEGDQAEHLRPVADVLIVEECREGAGED